MTKKLAQKEKKAKTSFAVLNLDELVSTEGNPQTMTDDELAGMIKSMSEKGWLLDAPVVWKREDGKYQILSGHHRIKAAIAAEIKTTEVKIIEGVTKEKAELLVLEANQRKGRFDQQMFNDFVNGIAAEYGLDKEVIFEDIGMNVESFKIENFKDIEEFTKSQDVEGFEDVDIIITIPKKHEQAVKDFLAIAKGKHTAASYGQGVMKLCGLL